MANQKHITRKEIDKVVKFKKSSNGSIYIDEANCLIDTANCSINTAKKHLDWINNNMTRFASE